MRAVKIITRFRLAEEHTDRHTHTHTHTIHIQRERDTESEIHSFYVKE